MDDACDTAPRGMLDLDEAHRLALETARAVRAAVPLEPTRRPIWEARGRVLAEDVVADRDQPPFDRSAMDGVAVRAADVAGESATLELIGEVPAGSAWAGELGPGQALAIYTGAPVPAGADAVQMVERTRREGDARVVVEGPLEVGQHIAPQGEDVRRGDVVAEAGRVIDGLTCGVLASVGASRVTILRRPRVAVLSSGSELVDLDDTPEPAQIRDSNRFTLIGMLGERCRAVDLGRVEDTPEALAMAIREGLKSDVLVLSGGVSAGEYDLVADALSAEGVEIIFHKVRVKPGKPVLLGRHDRGLVFGLPGNPVSTFVTAQLLMLPALRVLAGRQDPGPWKLTAAFEGDLAIPKTKGRTTFHSGLLRQEPDGRFAVRRVHYNGSGDQVGFARGNCLIRREIGSDRATAGELVTVVLGRPPVW